MSETLLYKMLGITNPANPWASTEAHFTLTGEILSPDGVQEEISALRSRFLSGKATETDEQRHSALMSIDHITSSNFLDGATVLADWPAYQQLMDFHGRQTDGRAMLIGAYSAFSARAFTAFAEEELGTGPDNAFVADVVGGDDKARHGHFVQGSGLDLPFADASMSVVMTNRLLHQLVNPGEVLQPPAVNQRRLMTEIHRVLAPGGQLLMVERASIDSDRPAAELIGETAMLLVTLEQLIEQFDFEERVVDFPPDYDNDFLTKPYGRFYQDAIGPCVYAVSAYARKPAA